MERFQQASEIDTTEIDGEAFLVEPQSQGVFYLDPLASGLWRYLVEPRTLAECQAVFREAFPDQDPEKVNQDVDAAIRAMVERHLARVLA